MANSSSVLQEKIIAHPYFQKSKNVIENNICHKNESVYDHLILTAKRAEESVTGAFITNKKAKALFDNWMQKDSFDMKYREIAVLTALLHDIGKILVYEENGKQISINRTLADNTTMARGHEYWGGTVAQKIGEDVGMDAGLIDYIKQVIIRHNILMFPEFDHNKTVEEHISDMKTLGQGFEKEILFNIYVDIQTCSLFTQWTEVIIQMFNNDTLYQKRNYFVI